MLFQLIIIIIIIIIFIIIIIIIFSQCLGVCELHRAVYGLNAAISIHAQFLIMYIFLRFLVFKECVAQQCTCCGTC